MGESVNRTLSLSLSLSQLLNLHVKLIYIQSIRGGYSKIRSGWLEYHGGALPPENARTQYINAERVNIGGSPVANPWINASHLALAN